MAGLRWLVRIVLGIVLVPGAVAGALYFLEKNGFFAIDTIEIIIGDSPEQKSYLQPLVKDLDADLETLRGESLWKVDLNRLNSKYAQLPWIEDIVLSRQWPNKLKVDIRCKEIRLMIMTKNGRFIPIVKNGEMLPPLDLKQLPDVALLQGENFETKSELRKKAVTMLNEIPHQGPFSQTTISEIHFDDKDGFWMTLIQNGIRVKMGQDQIAAKSLRVSQVLEYVDSRKLKARVIDANLSKKVLVRLRKGP